MAKRLSGLQALQASFAKTYGPDSAMFASEIPPDRLFSCGSLALDYAIGLGRGLPSNRVIEFCGAPGSGKSTIALHAMNNRLRMEHQRAKDEPDYEPRGAIYIDQEGRMTEAWLRKFVDAEFVDNDEAIILWPDTMEDGTDMYVKAVRSRSVAIAIYDSIGGAPSDNTAAVDKKTGEVKSAHDKVFAGNSQAVTRFANWASGASRKYDVTTIGINQIREDLKGYGALKTPSGIAWKHACSLRVHLRPSTKSEDFREDTINGEKFRVGYKVIAKVIKNSLAPNFREATYWFSNVECKYGIGVDTLDEIINIGILTGVIERVNLQTYSHPTIGNVRGRDAMVEAIKNSAEAQGVITDNIQNLLTKGGIEGLAESFDPSEYDGMGSDEPESPIKAYVDLVPEGSA